VTDLCRQGSVYEAFIVRRMPLSNGDTWKILRQSASGILHLHKEGIIHRDIAARNFLLNERFDVFVSDFGLARIKEEIDQHSAQSDLGPVRHMAPESIERREFSEASDAYSFGMYMWEVTHRAVPYAGMEAFQIAVGVVNGSLRPTIDVSVDKELASLMQDCWHSDPTQRPMFDEIHRRLKRSNTTVTNGAMNTA